MHLTLTTARKIAIGLTLFVALMALVGYDLPGLFQRGADSDPVLLILGSLVTDILAFVACYGIWRSQQWGLRLLLGVIAYWIFQSVYTLVVAKNGGDMVFATIMLIHHLIVLMLVYQPERRATQANA